MSYNTAGNTGKALVTLRHTLHGDRNGIRGHKDGINRIAWSHDGLRLASTSRDKTVRIWDTMTGNCPQTLKGHSQSVYDVAWSPNGTMLASCSRDKTVRIWDTQTGQFLYGIDVMDYVNCVGWSPDGNTIATGSSDQVVRLWDAQSQMLIHEFTESSGPIISMAWSPRGEYLAASSSGDHVIYIWSVHERHVVSTLKKYSYAANSIAWSPDGKTIATDAEVYGNINLWDAETGRLTNTILGHTAPVRSLSFSHDGKLLASKSADETVRIWRLDTREAVEILDEATSNASVFVSVSFHPHLPVLATLGEYDRAIRLWDVNTSTLFGQIPISHTSVTDYVNAKGVLLGDSGVGKTGLGLVLHDKKSFRATESTHGRYIWSLSKDDYKDNTGTAETREILLWDLAGQSGYRLIHQLHLRDVAVALVLFDSRSETDPFAGVYHWIRALQTAERIQNRASIHIKKILVAARIDRGGRPVSPARMEELKQELGLDDYIETSAKEGTGIPELLQKIKDAIDWTQLLHVTYEKPFQNLRGFLEQQKADKKYISSLEDLDRAFMEGTYGKNVEQAGDLYALFHICMKQMDNQGLVKLLHFGNLVLLQPEFLDAYASALVNAAKDEPDGMGSIVEEQVLLCNFRIPADERLPYHPQEKLLLIAMIEDLLANQIALREQYDDKIYLVFPSQATVERSDLPNPEGKAVIFSFEGPVMNIYATLVVRLALCGIFMKRKLWKNAAEYTTKDGGNYGLFIEYSDEGYGELVLFFDKAITSEENRILFENYIATHLDKHALPKTIRQRRVLVCPECGTLFSGAQVVYRLKKQLDWITCSVCETRVPLSERQIDTSLIQKMDEVANKEIKKETTNSAEQGEIAVQDYMKKQDYLTKKNWDV